MGSFARNREKEGWELVLETGRRTGVGELCLVEGETSIGKHRTYRQVGSPVLKRFRSVPVTT